MEASCWGDKEALREHLSAEETVCHCGLYIQRDPEPGHGTVRANCTGWGLVAIEERGWHCEFARIEKLWVPGGLPKKLMEQLRERYEAPILVEGAEDE